MVDTKAQHNRMLRLPTLENNGFARGGSPHGLHTARRPTPSREGS